MIKLTSKYNKKTDICSVKADIKNTNTLEHLYAIAYLIESITKNDVTTPYDEIVKILDELFLEKKKEGKKNGKRNSKSKTEV